MTGTRRRQTAAADVPLYRRVERRTNVLARRMLDTFVEEIPLYRLLPREQLEGEILDITRANLWLFFAALREARMLTVDELLDIRMSAARRAEERVPLDAVLTAYHVGGRIGWEALCEDATPEETEALLAAANRVLLFVQQVTSAVASAYLEEQQSIYGEERDARRALASALLNGEPVDALAARFGVDVAGAYVVIALRVESHADEADEGVGGAVAARRKLRRLQGALDAFVGESALALFEPAGGAAVLPVRSMTTQAAAERVGELAGQLQEAAGAPVLAGAAVASSAGEVQRANRQAHEVLRLAHRLGLPAGGYQLADVLLEYQLTRPSDALDELARLLDPLDRNPDLPLTLEIYLANDLDRRRTAAALHVHPNTLDYRLRRIVDLTGLDPASTRGLQLLGAAVAARRLAAV